MRNNSQRARAHWPTQKDAIHQQHDSKAVAEHLLKVDGQHLENLTLCHLWTAVRSVRW